MAITGESFTEFKQRFYKKAGDLRVFDCMEFNLLKVVLDGLKVNYTSGGKAGTRFFYPGRLFEWSLRLKAMKNRPESFSVAAEKLRHLAGRRWLLVDHSGRASADEQGKAVSLYFHNILTQVGAGNAAHLVEKTKPLDYPCDLPVKTLDVLVRAIPFDRDDRQLRDALAGTYSAVVRQRTFDRNELRNMAIAIEKFFHEYRLWKHLLTVLPQRTVWLLCHYHREGAILAMRRAGRKVYELQHGLIAAEDIFYCFPEQVKPIRSRALFPDKIFVYGQFWKDRLLSGAEFTADQIGIAGYYLHENKQVDPATRQMLETFCAGRKVVLITTQTFLHDIFTDYARWLAGELADAGVVLVRPHPAENAELYGPLEKLGNVRVTRANLPFLMQLCTHHVTSFSTTVFDALRYGRSSFSIDVKAYDDYIRSMEQDGVTRRISSRTNPLLLDGRIPPPDPSLYFAPFRPEVFTNENGA